MSHTSGIIQKLPTGLPKAQVDTTAIDFGKVRVGKCSRDTTIKVFSIGASPLSIDSLVLFGTDAAFFTVKTGTPDTVNPGKSIAVTLAFCPNSLKCPANATLRIYTNDGYRDIRLIGCGIQPQMVITPLIVDFGRVRVGECKDTTVTILNTGTDTLTVNSETVGDARFIVLDTPPLHIPAGDSLIVHLRFCPFDTSREVTHDTVVSDAPQSPIILTLIGGGKEGILSVPLETLDFGDVLFGTCRDTGFYATNVGNDSLVLTENVIKTFVPPPGNLGFQYVSPTLPWLLLPGDSVFIRLRFCSTDTSTVTGIDSVITNYPKSGWVLLRAHTGYGILSVPDSIDFGSVIVGSCKDTIVPFTNTGTDTLVMTSIPNLPPVFTIASALPVRIAPGAVVFMTLRYCPADTVLTVASSHVDVDTPSVSAPITLLGRGIQGELSTSGPIDFGCVVQGDSQSIVLRNTGTAPITGLTATIGGSPDLAIVFSPASTLPPGASDSVVVAVTPTVLGDVSATVTITWMNGTPLTVPVTAHVSLPPKITVLDSVVDFGTVNVGDTSGIACIRITNYSCISVDATNITIGPNATEPFEIVSSNVPTSLADSAIATVCVRFIPVRNGSETGTLEFVNGTDTTRGTTLTGTGSIATIGVELSIDTVFGVPGQTVPVAVRVLNDITSAGVTSLTFRVQFNPMQLDMKAPVAPITGSIAQAGAIAASTSYSVKKYSIGDQEITATFPSPLIGTPIIAELPFEILLPQANIAGLHLLSASFGTSPAILSTASDGAIIIEQCDTTDRVQILPQAIIVSQNSPNPFNPRTSVMLDVNEAGHVKIEVFNVLGMVVMTPFDGEVSLGKHEIIIDAITLPSGSYRYVTQWIGAKRSSHDEKTMVVVK